MKRIQGLILYFIGIIIMPLGVVFTIKSHLGAGGYDALNFILAERINLNVKWTIYLTAGIFIIITSFIRRSKPRVKTYIASILLGFMTDLWQRLLVGVDGRILLTQVFLFIAGMLVISLGVAAYMLSGFPTNPTDDFVVALNERGWSIKKAKIFMDCICVVIAFALGGEIGFTTIIITFMMGPIVNFFYDSLDKLLSRKSVVHKL